jgi:hypothetical protein
MADYNLIRDWMVSSPLRLHNFSDSIVNEEAVIYACENNSYTAILCCLTRKTVKSILAEINSSLNHDKLEVQGLLKEWLSPVPLTSDLGQTLRLLSIYNQTGEKSLFQLLKIS